MEAKRPFGAAIGIGGREGIGRRVPGAGEIGAGRAVLQNQVFVFERAEQHRESGEQTQNGAEEGSMQCGQRATMKGAK